MDWYSLFKASWWESASSNLVGTFVGVGLAFWLDRRAESRRDERQHLADIADFLARLSLKLTDQLKEDLNPYIISAIHAGTRLPRKKYAVLLEVLRPDLLIRDPALMNDCYKLVEAYIKGRGIKEAKARVQLKAKQLPRAEYREWTDKL